MLHIPITSIALGSWLIAHGFLLFFQYSHVEISGDERNGKDKEGMAV
jgi:hypothetical protein